VGGSEGPLPRGTAAAEILPRRPPVNTRYAPTRPVGIAQACPLRHRSNRFVVTFVPPHSATDSMVLTEFPHVGCLHIRIPCRASQVFSQPENRHRRGFFLPKRSFASLPWDARLRTAWQDQPGPDGMIGRTGRRSSRKARSVPSASHRRPCRSLNTDSWPDMRKVFPAHPHSAVAHDFSFTAGEYTTAV
jgi:hypothetical protein